MMILTVRSLGFSYDLDTKVGKAILFEDLLRHGFFMIPGNESFVEIFDKNPSDEEIKHFIMNILFWERCKFPSAQKFLVN